MIARELSIRQAVIFTFKTVTHRFGFIILIPFITVYAIAGVEYITNLFIYVVARLTEISNFLIEVLSIYLSLASQITRTPIQIALTFLLLLGLTAIGLKFVRGEKPEITDLIGHPKRYWQFAATTAVYSVVYLAGFTAFIVPGLLWGARFMFVPFLVLDQNLNFQQAFRTSKDLTEGYTVPLFWLHATFAAVITAVIIGGKYALEELVVPTQIFPVTVVTKYLTYLVTVIWVIVAAHIYQQLSSKNVSGSNDV